jgi:tripartite-type tricarboxylate transporter receptor subunit TctC
LHAEIVKIIKSADMQERFAKLGLDPSGMTPAELAKFQASEIAKWAAVIKAANINIE